MYLIAKTAKNKRQFKKPMFLGVVFILFLLFFLIIPNKSVLAAPFGKYFHFTQPDGVELTLWGEGDEFYAVFETTTGYTVIFDPNQQAYFYAKRASDGKSFVSTGAMAHKPVPSGLATHIRMDHDAVAAEARARQKKWDEDTELSKRWHILKSQTLGTPLQPSELDVLYAPPGSTTVGTKTGLTLLIDFSDVPSTIAKAEIESFVNGNSYTGFGNNGSVKSYYSDVSASRLTYTNVVTIYIRMAQPKSYYNDTTKDCGVQGRLLINDALTILKARSDYTSTILPTFSSVTTDGSGNVVACNVYFAGADSGVWSYGLWPHAWVLASPVSLGNGHSVYRYQITNIGTSLELGTFCHENGHMLCGFPDLYDYNYDSKGGAGVFSLMGYGGSGGNPAQVDAYLKFAAGWETATDLDSSSNLVGTLVAAPNSGYDQLYRYQKPGITTEYFLLENRQKSGRDAILPTAGIAVWHVDELGDRDNQSLVPNSLHHNYELTLVQADNLWHFENNVNSGDAFDLYYQGNSSTGYTNRVDDSSAPNAHWWDGTTSGINFNSFSIAGMSMTFTIGGGGSLPAPILSAEPSVTQGTENTIYWSAVSTANNSLSMNASQQSMQPACKTLTGKDADGSKPVQLKLNKGSLFVPHGEGKKVISESGPLEATTIFNETFEGDFPGSSWALYGDPTWDDTSYDKHGGSSSGWCADSSVNPASGYVNNMNAWMVYGPFSLADASSAILSFWYKNYSELGSDNFSWCASVDDIYYYGYYVTGDQNSWRNQVFDLTNVPDLGDLRGQPQVWIAFNFYSNSSYSGDSGYTGAYVDDILITKDVASGPNLTPYQPSGWSDKIVVSNVTGTNTDSSSLHTTDALYVDLAVINNGTADTAVRFYTELYVDEVLKGTFYTDPPLSAGYFGYFSDFSIGTLSAGPHTIRIKADSTGVITESNESDNEYTRTITITAPPAPTQYSAECSIDSSFTSTISSGWITDTQWTFTGLIPGQTYWYRVKAKSGATESSWSNVVYSQQAPTGTGKLPWLLLLLNSSST